uniref:C2H2-type domain-containing protein n=1 Tax=Eptatretus burgeri TaxID=7764 RepID=A0A8C4QGZ9_EPTBU
MLVENFLVSVKNFIGFQSEQLENVSDLTGIGFSDVCNLHHQDDGLTPKSGEGDVEDGANFQMDISQNVLNSSVQINESNDASMQESSSASLFVPEQLRGRNGQITSWCGLALKKSFLKKHLRGQNSPPLKSNCTSGPRNTKLNVKLSKHKPVLERRIHPKYNVCTMDFTTTGDLKKPTNGDNNQREHPFKCYICGKDFISQENLNGHRTTHAGEHPHKCFVCSKGFLYKYLLKTHMRIHTGERPCKCSKCDKCFYQKRRLESPCEDPYRNASLQMLHM